jgi:hypothetical protein
MASTKKRPGPTPFTFLSGWVQDRNILRVTAQVDAIDEAGSTATRRMKWQKSTSKWSSFTAPFRMVRIVTTDAAGGLLIAVSPQGSVSAGDATGGWEEQVDPSKEGPTRRGDIRDLRVIGGEVYCAGMGRQVYQRFGKNRWEHIDAGVVQQLGLLAVSGFNSIDGVDAGLLFAAGFLGEIWCRKDSRWIQMSSPTNVILHSIRVLGPDRVFCSGQKGVLLEWDGNLWNTVDLGDLDENIWCIEWFQDHLYMATEMRLFRLTPGYKLEEVKGLPSTDSETRRLHANDGLLLATGPKHVWMTQDGSHWDDITP